MFLVFEMESTPAVNTLFTLNAPILMTHADVAAILEACVVYFQMTVAVKLNVTLALV